MADGSKSDTTPTRAGKAELLPCPFCLTVNGYGAWPIALRKSPPGAWYVNCDGCGADGPICDLEADAIAAWNRRSPSPAPSQDAEARAASMEGDTPTGNST